MDKDKKNINLSTTINKGELLPLKEKELLEKKILSKEPIFTLQCHKKQGEHFLNITKKHIVCSWITTTLIFGSSINTYCQYLNTKEELKENKEILLQSQEELQKNQEELKENKEELQKVQLTNKQIESTRITSKISEPQENAFKELEEKAILLEEKIDELETIKTTLNQQLIEVIEVVPAELSQAIETSLNINSQKESERTYINYIDVKELNHNDCIILNNISDEITEIQILQDEITKNKTTQLVTLYSKIENLQNNNTINENSCFVELIKTSYNADIAIVNHLEKIEEKINQTDFEFTAIATSTIETLSAYVDVPQGTPVQNSSISSGFYADGRIHKGIDLTTRGQALPITATAHGIVIHSRYNTGGYGNYVVIDHGNGYETLYAHNKENLVKVGDVVKKGDVIAITGTTGMSTGVHCHYEVILNGIHQNPSNYL